MQMMNQIRSSGGRTTSSCFAPRTFRPSHQRAIQRHRLLSTISRGHDLLGEALAFGAKPKVILDAYGASGFDVLNILENVDKSRQDKASSGVVHMTGSILAFPHSCFLWKNVDSIASLHGPAGGAAEDHKSNNLQLWEACLAPVFLYRPRYFFLGSNRPLEPGSPIPDAMRERGIVFQQLDLANAMGTFNILNGEDRTV